MPFLLLSEQPHISKELKNCLKMCSNRYISKSASDNRALRTCSTASYSYIFHVCLEVGSKKIYHPCTLVYYARIDYYNSTLISFPSPRFELPATDVQQKDGKKLVITCHYCGETGHKAMYCNKMPPEMKEAQSKQEDFRVSF